MNWERLWDVGLGVLFLAVGALGVANPASAPLWLGLAAIVMVVLLAHWQRHRIGALLVTLGTKGNPDAVTPFIPAPPPAPVAPDPAIARARDEQRTVIRTVRDAIGTSMVSAHEDRDHGRTEDRSASLVAANIASLTAHEIRDDEARELVAGWRRQFDDIYKNYGEAMSAEFGHSAHPAGYPEPDWSFLREAADRAQTRLGTVLRDL